MDTIPTPEVHFAPTWSLQVGEIGRVLVLAAVFFFVVAAAAALFAPKLGKTGSSIAKWAFALGSSSILGTFVALATLFVENRFEFEYVWGHADTKNAVPYRIAGIWSGQEGSFLLWGVCATLFCWFALRMAGKYQRWFTIACSLFLFSIAGILSYESPFKLIMVDGRAVVPFEGVGLAPSLQNYWVIIHPPVIFLGFGSLTVLFAFAIAALMEKDYTSWVPLVRPWAIVSTTLVGLGLCMGGFWAYETLGWGGFWMWDPVENVSFVPWCITAAFLHGLIVQATRKKWHFANLMLGAAGFITFVYGTFLTRSGFLADASVHSFAEMNRSALQLLIGLMAVSTLGFLITWTVRFIQFRKVADRPEEVTGLNREGFYKVGAMLLVGLSVATLIGMSVPLVMALQGKPPTVVEEKVYHAVVPWLFIPIMVFMAIAPFVSWKRMSPADFWSKFYGVLCITVGLIGFILLSLKLTPMGTIADLNKTVQFPGGLGVASLPWILVLTALCVFAIVGNVWRMLELAKGTKLGLAPFVTHVGVAVLMAGLIISRGFERKQEVVLTESHPAMAMNYAFAYKGMTSNVKDRDNKVKIDVIDPKTTKTLFTATPGYYMMTAADGRENPMVWPHIQRYALHDVYITLHPPQPQETDPFELAPGKSIEFGSLKFTYEKMVRDGEMGMAGTTFGAQIKVTGGKEPKTVTPKMEIAEGGANMIGAEIDPSLHIEMVGMNAATKSVTLKLKTTGMMYPIEIFNKPLTSLVWLGTGLMTLGGLLAAVYRRVPAKAKERAQEPEAEDPTERKKVLVTT